MGVCDNKGICKECTQGLHLPGDQLNTEHIYFALRYYGKEMINFENKPEGDKSVVLAFGPGFGLVENGVISD